MSTLKLPVAFSPDGEYLAYSSPDGRLKIWETSTNVLKQEYTPTSHLSSTCRCMSWCSTKFSYNSPRKKKKIRSENHDVVAMGTTSGNILLYSIVLGDLLSQLDDGHNDVVNDISFLNGSASLFSCSSDAHIIEWDVKSSKVKSKWKADKGQIHAVSVLDSQNLLSASSSIKWWDLKKKQVVKTFVGHATEVFRLIPIVDEEYTNESYILSTALDDRLINAWQLKQNENSGALASFMPSEEPVQVDLSTNMMNDQPLLLSAVTRSGVLHLFELHLNGRCKKPLAPKVTIRISSEGTKKKCIPILGAHVQSDREFSVLLVYGSFHNPMFETISYKECKVEEVLIRKEMSYQAAVVDESTATKIKRPNKSGPVQHLAPGHMTPMAPILGDASPRKTRQRDKTSSQLPMEERLNALQIENRERPTADNLVHLLMQGLQSGDKRLLNSVLYKEDVVLIQNTVQRLPITSIVPLLKELYQRLHSRGLTSYLLWTKGILSAHTSYLISCQEVDTLLGPLSQLMEARTEVYSKMCRLKGRLQLMLSQIARRDDALEIPQNALLVYNEVSSSDEEQVEKFTLPNSEPEEDLSDMETEEYDKQDQTSSSDEKEDI